MASLPGGAFLMGTDDAEGFPADGEGPVRKVVVSPFHIDVHAVTNRRYATFVKQTGYVTEAERFGWSFAFHASVSPATRATVQGHAGTSPWWLAVPGACWRHPEGPDSSIGTRPNHPVVHVSWHDANAYCDWAGARLPTEAEWEYGARGGLEQQRYPWGDELRPRGRHRCNIWWGRFPTENTAEDGFVGTAPVNTYAPNGYGLFNTVGNVWEWCRDWFATDHPDGTLRDPDGPSTGERRVTRGGSFLCHDSYCNCYRVAARSSSTADSAGANLGFRCVRDI